MPTKPAAVPARAAARSLVTRSTRGDSMPKIKVGDLVRRSAEYYNDVNKVYLVAQVESRADRDSYVLSDPSWVVLHGDDGKLTAAQSLVVVRKA